MGSKYDVAVLGGGPGGYVAAIRCASLGMSTVLIEKGSLGGTCLNRGCVPTKSLLHSAGLYKEMKTSASFGITAADVSFNFADIMKRKNEVVAKLTGGVGMLLKKAGVDVIQGVGKLVDVNTIEVDAEKTEADNIILATGSEPAMPPIPGIEEALNSDDVLSMIECPESCAIVGGGVIGIEFASIFSLLGKKVTIIEVLPEILTGMDEEISAAATKLLKGQGVEIIVNAKVLEINNGVCVYESGNARNEVKAEAVIVAAGRKPATEGLGLEKTGVVMEKGFIKVDDAMRTSIPHIYAIGDITGKIQLAHVASAQGIVAASNIAGKDEKMRYDNIPSCVYTFPEIAAVGLTEKQAREGGHEYKIGRFPVAFSGKSSVMGESFGFVKLISDEGTGELLGAHMMAPRATDIIAELCVLKQSEATIDELAQTIHPHPTISEMLMEAAHDIEGLSVHTPGGV